MSATQTFRLLVALFHVVTATLIALISYASVSADARELRAADNQMFDFPTVQAITFMDRYIRDRTNNIHRIRVFPSAQLGEEEQAIEQARRGVIDIVRVSMSPLATLVPEVDLFNAPYFFKSLEHLRRVTDGPVGEEILRRFEPHGLIGLAFYESGARSIYNSVLPIRVVKDVAGMRIRVQRSTVANNFVEALGGIPVPLSYSQVLPALRARLIDGAENNWPSYVTTDHHLAARFYTLTNHMMVPDVLFMSAKTWHSFALSDRALLRDAARASAEFVRRRWDLWTEMSLKQAIAEGVTVVDDFDRSGFQAALKSVQDDVVKGVAAQDIVAKINALSP